MSSISHAIFLEDIKVDIAILSSLSILKERGNKGSTNQHEIINGKLKTKFLLPRFLQSYYSREQILARQGLFREP